jgi:glycosyltransferase involved in cell wall biosynthesis
MAINRRLHALSGGGTTTVLSAYPDSFPPDLAREVDVRRLRFTGWVRPGLARHAVFTIEAVVWALFHRLKGSRYDVVYSIQDSSAAVGLVIRRPGTIWLIDVLDDPQLELRNAMERGTKGKAVLLTARDRAFRYLVRRADVVSTIGTSESDPLPQLLRTEYRVSVPRILPLPQCVDLTSLPRLPLPEAGDAAVIFYVGWVSPLRGVDVLAEATRILRGRGLIVQLRLAGYMKRADAVWFRDVEANLGSAVEYLGELTAPQVSEEIARALVCACPFPDRRELRPVQPVKVLEYLAAGRPIVASRLPGIQALVEDGVSGILVTPGDASALAEAIEEVICDRGLVTRLARFARTRAHAFDASRVDKMIMEAVRSA